MQDTRECVRPLQKGKIPFDPTDATIYYVGPTPAKPGAVIGSAGLQPADVWMPMHPQ